MSGFIPGASNSLPFISAFAFIASDGNIAAGAATLNITSSLLFSPGVYFIDYTAANFTVAPQVFIQLMEDAGATLRYGYLADASNTVAEIHIFDDTNAPSNNRFRLWAVGT